MCQCFKPAYSDYDFANGLGVLGHLMHDIEHIGFELFSGVATDADSSLAHLNVLTAQLSMEQERARQEPFDEIPQFKITWSPADDFQQGYLGGLSEMLHELGELRKMITSARNSNPNVNAFNEVIYSWAEKWQQDNESLNFMRAPMIAYDEMGQHGVRILSSTRASVVTDGDPTSGIAWLEIEELEVHPVESLVSELWSKLAHEGFGLSFSRGEDFTGPGSLDHELYSFEFGSLCESHWQDVVLFNNEKLKAAGLLPSAQ